MNGPAKSQSPPRFQIATEQKRSDNDLAGRALRAIHREASRVGDGALEAFVVVHSLGGGTGSGLGSRLVELLRRYYTFNSLRDDDTDAEWLAGEYGERHRALYVVSVCVTPLMSGEIPVQSMNATLTLSSISRSCDAVIMIRNDDFVLDLQLDDGMAKVNERIVQLLLPVLRFGRSCGIIGDLISYCCPDPRRAFLTLLPFDDKAAHRLSGFYASALASRLYAVADSHDAASSMPEVPVQSLHVQWSAAIAPATCSQCLVRPPRDCASCPSVLVLNQMKELSKRTLFPLVSSCYQKLEVGAYRDTFEAAGVHPYLHKTSGSVCFRACREVRHFFFFVNSCPIETIRN